MVADILVFFAGSLDVVVAFFSRVGSMGLDGLVEFSFSHLNYHIS